LGQWPALNEATVCLDQTRCVFIPLINDGSSLLELEEGSGIYLTKLTLGWTKPTLKDKIRLIRAEGCWAAAKKFVHSI